jgi:flagellar protein FliO/FliZ
MPTPSLASEPFASPHAAAPLTAAPGAGNVLEMLLALALVLAAIFALAWLMRRLRALPGGRSSLLRQVAELQLGDKERVVVVAAGQQYWLLGVSPGRVSLLQVLDPSAIPVPQATASGTASADPPAANFAAALRRSMGLDR